MRFVEGGVVAWQQDGAAGQAGFYGVQGRSGFTGFGGWTGGELAFFRFALIWDSVDIKGSLRLARGGRKTDRWGVV